MVFDDDGVEVALDAEEAASLFAATGDLEAATVSACPDCRSRVLACLALVDVIDASALHPRGPELVELADDAPTSHLYVRDLDTQCRHRRWLDPGSTEWAEVVHRVSAPAHPGH